MYQTRPSIFLTIQDVLEIEEELVGRAESGKLDSKKDLLGSGLETGNEATTRLTDKAGLVKISVGPVGEGLKVPVDNEESVISVWV